MRRAPISQPPLRPVQSPSERSLAVLHMSILRLRMIVQHILKSKDLSLSSSKASGGRPRSNRKAKRNSRGMRRRTAPRRGSRAEREERRRPKLQPKSLRAGTGRSEHPLVDVHVFLRFVLPSECFGGQTRGLGRTALAQPLVVHEIKAGLREPCRIEGCCVDASGGAHPNKPLK